MFHDADLLTYQMASNDFTIQQAAAVCLIIEAHEVPAVLLVRSRRTGGWGLPKGSIEAGETGSEAAAREAFEECGVQGDVEPVPAGHFTYRKAGMPCLFHVAIHVLRFKRQISDFPEKDTREAAWFSMPDAIDAVSRPQVRDLLTALQPATAQFNQTFGRQSLRRPGPNGRRVVAGTLTACAKGERYRR
jgi:8-oxo-dGTP pyrophosphatase MutT (NUDIX family)